MISSTIKLSAVQSSSKNDDQISWPWS